MNTPVIPELEEQRRDALVDYYLGQIVPSTLTSSPPSIITPEDLYEYLLIDNQVNAQVETSRVAQAIASIQQYIHAIFNGMEPGYPDGFDTGYLQLWREGLSEYSVWAGYQMIEDYPENYIDPTLRLTKTEQFKELELELGQSRITQDSVQTALRSYLNKFEIVSNLNCISGYIDSANYKQGGYYFLGRQNVEPFSHYWRKAEIAVDDSTLQVPASVWTSWKKIDVALSAKVSHARLVVIEGRVHVIWMEYDRPEVTDEGKKTGNHFHSINMSFKQLNDMWSPASRLSTLLTSSEDVSDSYDSSGKRVGNYAFIATVDTRSSVSAPSLIICFYKRALPVSGGAAEPEVDKFLSAYNKQFNKIFLSAAAQVELYNIVARVSSNSAQLITPVEGVMGVDNIAEDWKIENISRDLDSEFDYPGALSPTISFNATLHGNVDGERYFNIQGVCEARETIDKGYFVGLESSSYEVFTSTLMDFGTVMIEVSGTPSGFLGRVLIKPMTPGSAQIGEGEWFINEKPIGGVSSGDFGPITGGVFSLVATVNLDLSISDFINLTPPQIRLGAGVSFRHKNSRSTIIKYPEHESNTVATFDQPSVRTFSLSSVIPSNGKPVKKILGSYSLTLNGAAKTPVLKFPIDVGGDAVYEFLFGADVSEVGESAYKVMLSIPGAKAPEIGVTSDGAQFLSLESLHLKNLKYVRLNTLFAKELTKKAELSLESIFSWEVQHTPEPPAPDAVSQDWTPLDLNGANGRYFWEIFFHVPHLVAHRLHTEFDYRGAQN